jgi:hypothetical protein
MLRRLGQRARTSLWLKASFSGKNTAGGADFLRASTQHTRAASPATARIDTGTAMEALLMALPCRAICASCATARKGPSILEAAMLSYGECATPFEPATAIAPGELLRRLVPGEDTMTGRPLGTAARIPAGSVGGEPNSNHILACHIFVLTSCTSRCC